jgi:hypothetical protein
MIVRRNQLLVTWRKSTRSKDECCVVVGLGDAMVAIADSKDPDGPVLLFKSDDWSAFLRLVCATRC